MSNIKITDTSGNKPVFTQWDVDRKIYIYGASSKPYLHFSNKELSRAIVVESETMTGGYMCKVPNFALQFDGQMIVSVFLQPSEGYTATQIVIPVKPKMKPQDYCYTENIGYINWVQKSEEAQELIDEIQEKLDSGDFKGDKGDAFTYADFTEEQLASLKGDKGDTGDQGPQGAQGAALTWNDLTAEQKASLKGETGATGPQGLKGDKGDKGDAFQYTDFTAEQLEGLRGPQGVQGPRGPKGDQGLTGATGPQGPKGDKGDKGDQGDPYVLTAADKASIAQLAAEDVCVVSDTEPSADPLPMIWINGDDTNNVRVPTMDDIGELENLDTTDKSSIVAAINEVAGSGGGGGSISPYTSNPAALGTASPGSSNNYARGDHVHPKPSASDIGAYALPTGGIPASDLAAAVQTSLGKADTALQSYTETDPTVPSWAKASSKPSYTASEVGAIAAPASPASGAFLVWDGSAWTAQTLSTWQGGSY